MIQSHFLGRLLVGVALLGPALLWSANAQASGGKVGALDSTSKVKATFAATKIDANGKQTVTLTLDIEKKWHIYANPVGWDIMEAATTRVTVKAKDKVSANVEYPKGTVHKDGKETYSIYEGRVVIPVQVQRMAGDTGPLQIFVHVNACDDKNCLSPGKLLLTVP